MIFTDQYLDKCTQEYTPYIEVNMGGQMKPILFFTALLPLAGCMTAAEQLDSQKPTTAIVRKNIAEAARNELKDPYSIRDAEISWIMGGTQHTYVCVRANTRNGFGGYIGRNGYTVFMNNDRPVNMTMNNAWCNNPKVKYERFPELENLKNL